MRAHELEGLAEGPAVDAYMAGQSPAIAHFADQLDRIASKAQGVAEGTAGLPDPNDFDSDWEYQDALAAYGKTQDSDADYENIIDEPDDWFDESQEKVGNMDADSFDRAMARLKQLAGSGPMKTVYDPNTRRYKNVPTAVQPAQQPRKVNK